MSDGYPTEPVVEVKMGNTVGMMIELEVMTFRGFTLFERERLLLRIREAKKRGVQVVTIKGEYLMWQEYLNREQ